MPLLEVLEVVGKTMMSSVYVRKPSEERDNKNTKEKEKTLEE